MDEYEEFGSGLVCVCSERLVLARYGYTAYGHSRLSDHVTSFQRTEVTGIAAALGDAIEGGRGPTLPDGFRPGGAFRKALGRKSWAAIDRTCSQVVYTVLRTTVQWRPMKLASDGRGCEPVVTLSTPRDPGTDYMATLVEALAMSKPPCVLR